MKKRTLILFTTGIFKDLTTVKSATENAYSGNYDDNFEAVVYRLYHTAGNDIKKTEKQYKRQSV